MKLGYSPFIAFRYLRSKRKEVFVSIITVISVLGVAVSVSVLNLTLAIMTGFETELQTKLVDANAHISIRSFYGSVSTAPDIIARVMKIPGVRSAYPYTFNQAMLSSQAGSRGLLIRGVADDVFAREKLKSVVADTAAIDRLFDQTELNVPRHDGATDMVRLPGIVVGGALAKGLQLSTEQPVTLFSPELNASAHGLVPKLRRYAVVGTYKSGLIEYENGLAYLAMPDAQQFFGLGTTVTGVEVNVENLFDAPKVARAIADALIEAEVGLDVTDWTRQNERLWQAIKLEKKVYFIVLLLLVLVASFSIVSTLVLVVMEKGKDIAILKSMGATDSGIRRIFLIQGAVIGGVGVVCGTLLGLVGCLLLRRYGFDIDERVFSLNQVPVQIELGNFAVVAICGFAITALAGVYPARRAARLRPAEALRFE